MHERRRSEDQRDSQSGCFMMEGAGSSERAGAMEVTLSIPDDIAIQLMAAGGDLGRRALENFALENCGRAISLKFSCARYSGWRG